MEFVVIIRHLLAVAYPQLFYRVISETKEHDECGNRHQHLDIFLMDANSLPQYGFELVVEATHSVFEEHCRHADYYRKLHDCSMLVINLCTQNILSEYFGPTLLLLIFYDTKCLTDLDLSHSQYYFYLLLILLILIRLIEISRCQTIFDIFLY